MCGTTVSDESLSSDGGCSLWCRRAAHRPATSRASAAAVATPPRRSTAAAGTAWRPRRASTWSACLWSCSGPEVQVVQLRCCGRMICVLTPPVTELHKPNDPFHATRAEPQRGPTRHRHLPDPASCAIARASKYLPHQLARPAACTARSVAGAGKAGRGGREQRNGICAKTETRRRLYAMSVCHVSARRISRRAVKLWR